MAKTFFCIKQSNMSRVKSAEVHRLYNQALGHFERWVGHNTTTADELNSVAKREFGEAWHGVYSSNQWPTLTPAKRYAIINNERTGKPGEHWVALFYTRDGPLLYDSFGRDTVEYFDVATPFHMITDPDAEQLDPETNCGARCLAFLDVCRTHGSGWAKLI